jgi:hypothetical protein
VPHRRRVPIQPVCQRPGARPVDQFRHRGHLRHADRRRQLNGHLHCHRQRRHRRLGAAREHNRRTAVPTLLHGEISTGCPGDQRGSSVGLALARAQQAGADQQEAPDRNNLLLRPQRAGVGQLCLHAAGRGTEGRPQVPRADEQEPPSQGVRAHSACGAALLRRPCRHEKGRLPGRISRAKRLPSPRPTPPVSLSFTIVR